MKKQQLIRVALTGLATIIPLRILSISPAQTQTAIDLTTLRNNALSKHNEYRATHHSGSVSPSDSLNSSAQNWANQIASKGVFEHSNISGVGENIYVSYTPESSIDAGPLLYPFLSSFLLVTYFCYPGLESLTSPNSNAIYHIIIG